MRCVARSWSVVLLVFALLQGCASDAAFLKEGDAQPDPQQLETDANACREFGPVVAGFFGGALYGAAEGALIGAASGGADVGAIIGAGAGGVIGLFVGMATSAAGDGYERCMTAKGYHRA